VCFAGAVRLVSEAIAIFSAAAQARRRRCRLALSVPARQPGDPDGRAAVSHPASCRRTFRRAFTYTELLVSVGLVGLLTALVLPVIGRSRATAQSVACLAHLRQIGAGLLQYAADNDKRLPDPFEVQVSWEELLLKYLPDKGVFRCPSDDELFPAVGSSYDWRDTGRPETTFAGRLITDTNRPDPVLAFEALPGWHVKGRMNAIHLSGAGSSMDQEACLEDLQQPIRPPPPPRAKGRGGRAGGGGDFGAGGVRA
jgi:type II secretory pathway pseudopilin PulG